MLGQSVGFNSSISDFSTSQIEIPSAFNLGDSSSENFDVGACPSDDLSALDVDVRLSAFTGFFQEDGSVNCE